MNVADYIVKFLADNGVSTIFMVTGGQAMFLNDAVYRNKKIVPVFTHHEQAAGMAAEAYGRGSGKLGVTMVTAGPGGINALNGVVGGWCDSAPMMVISGQSSYPTVSYMENNKIRQFGIQGVNIKSFVSAATKYFVTVDDPAKILYYLEKALYLATTGRHGPVWIDVPLDIQRMEVPIRLLRGYEKPKKSAMESSQVVNVSKIINLIMHSKRLLILGGQGVKISGGQKKFLELIDKLSAPVVTTRLGIDLIDSDSKLFVGRPGLYGDRAANFAVQNADLILIFGARLDTGIIGYDPGNWGKHAKKIVIDIDLEELKKPGIKKDLVINADILEILSRLVDEIIIKKIRFSFSAWVIQCNHWKKKYPTVDPLYKNSNPINTYYFSERLSHFAKKDYLILVDTSSCFHVTCQAWKIKQGQKFLTTGGISTMGYWPAGIGLSAAFPKRQTIIITGDGSLQMNVQEFATIKQNKFPIKIFIFNNGGYLLIRHTQKNHMEGRLMGESPKTGLWLPDSLQLAKTYGIKGIRINNAAEIDKKIKQVLSYSGPVICDVVCDKWQIIAPRIASEKQPDGSMISKPYEDLFPFLSSEELTQNMIADHSSSK